MKKTLSLLAVVGLLAVSTSAVPAQAETVSEPVVAPETVSVPLDAPAPVLTLVEAPVVSETVVEPVEAPVVAPETVEVLAVPVEPVVVAVAPVEPVVAPVEAPVFDPVTVVDPYAPEALEPVYTGVDPDPASLGYVYHADGYWVPAEPVVESEMPVVFEEPVVEAVRDSMAPVTWDPSENVKASDGSMVHPDVLADYEAELSAGVEQAIGFTTPVAPTPEVAQELPQVEDIVQPGHTVEP